MDIVIETPVISARYLAENLNISGVSAQKVIKKLVEARIVTPATGTYRRSALYQADEILNLLAYGAEAGVNASAPQPLASAAGSVPGGDEHDLVRRCGQLTAHGPCRNRVPVAGEICWRHRTARHPV
ncbi:hypothetical protein BH09ACT12_BH09ACT12_04630 [soil metagenome]